MEEEKDPSPQYIIGFNQGYQMAENLPDLLKSILKTPNRDNERLKGMEAGKRHYERESFIKEMGQAREKPKDKSGER